MKKYHVKFTDPEGNKGKMILKDSKAAVSLLQVMLGQCFDFEFKRKELEK